MRPDDQLGAGRGAAPIGLDHAVVEVGGVGLAVQATPNTLATLRRGQQARLATALVVREDSLTLFGFTDDEQRDVFGLLQSVAGIGPRMALATLAVLDPDTLAVALVERDIKTLTRVPGIGPKVAAADGAGARTRSSRPRRRQRSSRSGPVAAIPAGSRSSRRWSGSASPRSRRRPPSTRHWPAMPTPTRARCFAPP